jgi:hypothetical protein
MSNDNNIKCNSEEAASRLINLLGTGITKEMGIRELIMNGIEACLRNPNESADHQVLVTKDHEYLNKLAIINIGGDFLSQDIFMDNLATLANTGNNVNGIDLYDENKGIGAKIALLPKGRKGLEYRSKRKEDSDGIKSRMCENPKTGNYHLPTIECEFVGLTCFPVCFDFHPKLSNNTGTEVVCMGDYSLEDTWLDFDRVCSVNQSLDTGGSGYGILKYCNLRFFDKPIVDVKVNIYNSSKGTGSLRLVRGLKANIHNEGSANPCSMSGIVKLKYQGLNIDAHWGVIKDYGDKGFNSNLLSSGFTSVAWKGENYFDASQHALSIKKDLQDCGIIFKHKKVIIVFEIDREHRLQTDAKRTELYIGDSKIDKSLLHELFRENFPEELSAWQDEHKVNNSESRDLQKTLLTDMKNLGFGASTGNGSVSKSIARANNSKSGSSPKTKSGNKKTPSKRTVQKATAISNLSNFKIPEVVETNENDAELVEFFLNEYMIVIGTNTELYCKRRERILNRLGEPCLVDDVLDFELKLAILKNSVYRIFEINSSFLSLSIQQKSEKWKSEFLSANWSHTDEDHILKIIRRKNKEMKKAA